MTATQNDHHDAWVCVDCYFAHHYGAHPTVTGTDHLAPQRINYNEVDRYLAEGWTVRWYAGESDEPCDRKPLGLIDDDYEVADNTCSNHTWETDPDGESILCGECNQIDDGNREFSHLRCEGCGSLLGGARYRLSLWKAS